MVFIKVREIIYNPIGQRLEISYGFTPDEVGYKMFDHIKSINTSPGTQKRSKYHLTVSAFGANDYRTILQFPKKTNIMVIVERDRATIQPADTG